MKIKMKISYDAIIRGKTVAELFINAILKTYLEREEIIDREASPSPFNWG
jgi:hypothetical protein